MAGLILFLMIVLLFIGMPVGFALGVAGMIGLFLVGGYPARRPGASTQGEFGAHGVEVSILTRPEGRVLP